MIGQQGSLDGTEVESQTQSSPSTTSMRVVRRDSGVPGAESLRLPSSRKRGLRLSRLLLLVVALASAAMVLSPIADARIFGGRYLIEPCCDGDELYGTSSRIVVNSILPQTDHCIAFRNVGQDVSRHIQAGALRCGPASGGSSGTCSLNDNLIRFVEIINDSGYHCFPHGNITMNSVHNYAVQSYEGSIWGSWIDGTYFESNVLDHPEPKYVGANAETTDDDCGGWFAGATFSGTGIGYPWERLRPDRITWFVIQSAWEHIQGCWSTSGGPPGAFTTSWPG